MAIEAKLDGTYIPSDDVVFREVEGELIIIPLTSETVDREGSVFTFNETGRAIWDRLDGQCTLGEIVEELSSEFESPAREIERDVIGLVTELLKRKMVVEVSGA
jgi:hypothetical protein